MDYQIEQKGELGIIHISGNILTSADGKPLLEDIEEKIGQGSKYYALDLSEVSFINSSGLAMLIQVLTKARRNGGEVVLVNVTDQLSNLLVVTKLNAIFTARASIEDAESYLNVLVG